MPKLMKRGNVLKGEAPFILDNEQAINTEFRKVIPDVLHTALREYHETDQLTHKQYTDIKKSLDVSYSILDLMIDQVFDTDASNNLLQILQVSRQLVEQLSQDKLSDHLNFDGVEIDTTYKDNS